MKQIFIPMDGNSNRPRIVQVIPPQPLMGYIRLTLEDGTVIRKAVRTDAKIMSADFESAYHSAPWDYDDPDCDGSFKPITPDLDADEKR